MLGGLAALAAMAFGTGTAGATTITPQGPFTGTSSSVTFRFFATLPVTCTSSTLPGTVNAPDGGKSSITGGKPTFGNCWNAAVGLGPVEVTSVEPVNVEMTSLSGGVKTTVRNISLDFYYPKTLCRYDVLGTETTENAGLFPVTISQLAFSAPQTAVPAVMTVTHIYPGNKGGPCNSSGGIYTGQKVGFEATYKLDHSLIVSS